MRSLRQACGPDQTASPAPHKPGGFPPIGSVTVANKNIPDPGFSDDDGSADPRLSAALAAWAEDRSALGPVLEALKGARLLVPVVAVLGEVEEDENGLRREKTSDMAVPTPEGRRPHRAARLHLHRLPRPLGPRGPPGRRAPAPGAPGRRAREGRHGRARPRRPGAVRADRPGAARPRRGPHQHRPARRPRRGGGRPYGRGGGARRAPRPPRARPGRRHPRPRPRPGGAARRGRPRRRRAAGRRRDTAGPPGTRPRPGTAAGRDHATGRAPLYVRG